VREWCRHGRIKAQKRLAAGGIHPPGSSATRSYCVTSGRASCVFWKSPCPSNGQRSAECGTHEPVGTTSCDPVTSRLETQSASHLPVGREPNHVRQVRTETTARFEVEKRCNVTPTRPLRCYQIATKVDFHPKRSVNDSSRKSLSCGYFCLARATGLEPATTGSTAGCCRV
jgi:hypothetical protein